MILPSDFPYRFFNPLTSKHREDYIHVLLSLERVLEQAKRIALPRNAMVSELRRTFHRENYALDVSDEEDYDEKATDDPEQDMMKSTGSPFAMAWCLTYPKIMYQRKITSIFRSTSKMIGL